MEFSFGKTASELIRSRCVFTASDRGLSIERLRAAESDRGAIASFEALFAIIRFKNFAINPGFCRRYNQRLKAPHFAAYPQLVC